MSAGFKELGRLDCHASFCFAVFIGHESFRMQDLFGFGQVVRHLFLQLPAS